MQQFSFVETSFIPQNYYSVFQLLQNTDHFYYSFNFKIGCRMLVFNGFAICEISYSTIFFWVFYGPKLSNFLLQKM